MKTVFVLVVALFTMNAAAQVVSSPYSSGYYRSSLAGSLLVCSNDFTDFGAVQCEGIRQTVENINAYYYRANPVDNVGGWTSAYIFRSGGVNLDASMCDHNAQACIVGFRQGKICRMDGGLTKKQTWTTLTRSNMKLPLCQALSLGLSYSNFETDGVTYDASPVQTMNGRVCLKDGYFKPVPAHYDYILDAKGKIIGSKLMPAALVFTPTVRDKTNAQYPNCP